MHDPQLQQDIALWIIRLNCDDPDERAKVQLEFAEWQKSHPEFIDYIEEINNFSQNIQQLSVQHHLSAQTIQRTFHAVKKSQYNIHKLFQGALLAISTFAITAVIYKTLPFDYYFADYRTTTGQTHQYILSDGTRIVLGAKSAIELDFTAQQRNIKLIKGEVYVDVAKDPLRPLLIHTKHADFKALGTRFIVDQIPDQSRITMLHSKVQITAQAHVEHTQIVSMGQQAVVNLQGIQTIQAINPNIIEQAWQQQLIIAENMSLSELLQKLQQYHHHYMIFDQNKLNQIKVNGVINAKQDLTQVLKLIKTQHPEIDFIQFGSFVTYAKMK